MNSRPKPGETDEDILRQQEEFLQNKQKPSVTVVNSQNVKPLESPKNESKPNVSSIELPILIGNIVERTVENEIPREKTHERFSGGFPQAKRRQGTSTGSRGSIFSQQNKKRKENRELIGEIPENLPSCSFILEGADKYDLHRENVEKLSKMSHAEILEERNKLLDTLNPDFIAFLKAKREKSSVPQSNPVKMEQMEIEPIEERPEVSLEQIESAKEIVESSGKENWLNFDRIEAEKLEWMQNVDVPKLLENNEPYEARFDFAGWLLPYVEPEVTEKNRSLYHHGEEPGRPGYTLKELFTLCRSNVQQQRILALNTIANILSLHSTGVYDNITTLLIEQIFFMIRISIDDNAPAILNASIKALHHLFWSQVDEICLDALLSFTLNQTQPMLSVEDKDISKDEEKEINDQQLAEMDLVKCLARTDILIRIRYIINTVKPTTETILYCLEILIRLLRDSQTVALEVFNCEGLVESIVRHFVPKIYKFEMPKDNCYAVPLCPAVKFLRILASRSKNLSSELINRYHVMDSISSYISNDIGENVFGVKLQIESYNLLAVFLHYNLAVVHFQEVQPFLIRSLDYHFGNTNITENNSSYTKQNHFSALMNVISNATRVNFALISRFLPFLMQCVGKFCAQVSNLTKFECGKLQVISSLLVTISNVLKSSPVPRDDLIEKYVDLLLNSNGFQQITSDIKLGSNLLCDLETHKSSLNLNTVEAAMWATSEHVVPCFLTKSSIPFLNAVSYYIETSSDQLKLKFLQHPNVLKYLKQLKNCEKFNLLSNWFTRLENQCLMNIFKMAVTVQKSLTDPMFYYELTVKCLSIFTIEQKWEIDAILKNIVFNKQFYPNEMLMDSLRLETNGSLIAKSLDDLEAIYECYCEVMGLKTNTYLFSTTLTLDVRIGNIIPVDWVFLPLVMLYATNQEVEEKKMKLDEEKQILTITYCLEWILMFELYFPDLASLINPTDRFCRLSCVFLCSNSAFLDQTIHQLLEFSVKILIKADNWSRINFDKEIQGLNNFQDFYTQLLEQYQGVSYGDKLFANFILIPLAQRHNVKWRKMLWSEYIGVAQTIILNESESYISYQEFINPPEADISVLKCYRRAIISGYLTRSPFLQKIASFHVENYVKNKKK